MKFSRYFYHDRRTGEICPLLEKTHTIEPAWNGRAAKLRVVHDDDTKRILRRSAPDTFQYPYEVRHEQWALPTDRSWADNVTDGGNLFACNEHYLEVCNAYHHKPRASFAFMAFFCPLACLLAIASLATVFTFTGYDTVLIGLSLFFAVMMLITTGLLVYMLARSYRYTPVRLDRLNRRVYVSPHKPGEEAEIQEYDWDKLHFYIKETLRYANRAGRWYQYELRAGYLENGQMTREFSLGSPSQPSVFDPSYWKDLLFTDGIRGDEASERLTPFFEYLRRYMQEGPEAVPQPKHLLTTRPRLWRLYREHCSRELPRYRWITVICFWLLFKPFSLALGSYLLLTFARKPIWPPRKSAE